MILFVSFLKYIFWQTCLVAATRSLRLAELFELALPARASASRQSVTEAPVGCTDKEKISEPPLPAPYSPARLHVVCKPTIPPPHLSLRTCLSPPLSPLLVPQCASSSILSNAHAVWIVVCSTSKCPQTTWKKKKLSKGLFLHFEVPRFVLFLSPRFAHLVLCDGEGASSPRTLLIHTNDCPLFDVVEKKKAHTSGWEGDWEYRELSWTRTTSPGEGKHCARWGTELRWRRRRTGTRTL